MSLERYIDGARRRLRATLLARAAAVCAVVMLLVSAVGGLLVMTTVPAASHLMLWRAVLFCALLAGAVWLAWRYRELRRVGDEIERRVPAFGGRLATWLDATRRQNDSPLVELLAADASAVAASHPLCQWSPAHQLWAPLLVLLVALVSAGWFLTGSRPWQLAAQRLWTGDLLAAVQPRLLVEPGDAVVRSGADVVVTARALGFSPATMAVNAAFGGLAWEQAPMSDIGGDAYSFVLVGVTEDVEYYVAAEGLTSSRHRIVVAELPTVTEVRLRYDFPEWTALEPRTQSHGDVTALPGTRVTVQAFTDRPVDEVELVVDGRGIRMTEKNGTLSAEFPVERPGRWHVAVRHQGTLARISDEYLINPAEDAAPEIAFVWPGQDRKATPIEEVSLGFEARDDFGLESVVLRYAVNGGEWAEAALPADAAEHLLRLESLRVLEAGQSRQLQPGDVVTLYGEARDRTQGAQTALYFVDVRPFDLRYRESQQTGGQGGAEGGGFDIAERQRDILTATWNLIHRRDGLTPRERRDEADVLAMLQGRLAEQVETLITRSTARGLGSDPEVSEFIAELQRALEPMAGAGELLGDEELDRAVPAEQRALAHLVRAEATVRDIDVSMGTSDARGTSGRSLSELVELEMDPERNRYEMPQQPGFEEPSAATNDESLWERLDQLAARQEQLNRDRSARRDSLPSRWEQARLQRQLEELRDALADGRAGDGSRSDGARQALSELEAASEALSGGQSGEQSRSDKRVRSDKRGAEALRRAADAMRASLRGDLDERLARSRRRADNLQADQGRVMETLEAVQNDALAQARDGRGMGRSDFTMQTFGAVKRRMQQDVEQLRRELTDIADALAEDSPEAGRAIEAALTELDDSRVGERLAASAEAFDLGQPLYVIGSEQIVESALDRLGRRLVQAQRSVSGSSADGGGGPLAQLRELRRELEGTGPQGTENPAGVARVAERLQRLGRTGNPDDGAPGQLSGVADGPYHIRGTSEENTRELYRMTLEELDLYEATLMTRDSPGVRAQPPRNDEQNSAAAAKYFRDLSRGEVPEAP